MAIQKKYFDNSVEEKPMTNGKVLLLGILCYLIFIAMLVSKNVYVTVGGGFIVLLIAKAMMKGETK